MGNEWRIDKFSMPTFIWIISESGMILAFLNTVGEIGHSFIINILLSNILVFV